MCIFSIEMNKKIIISRGEYQEPQNDKRKYENNKHKCSLVYVTIHVNHSQFNSSIEMLSYDMKNYADLLDLHNSSYHTLPHPITAKYIWILHFITFPEIYS